MLTGGNGKCSQLQWQYKKSLRTLVRFFFYYVRTAIKNCSSSIAQFSFLLDDAP